MKILTRRARASALPVLPLCFVVLAGRAPAAEPARELPPVVSLEGALGLFRERGLDLLIADAAVAAAAGDLQAASAFPNPALSGSTGRTYRYDPSQCDGCSATALQASVSDGGLLADLVIGKRRLKVAVAKTALEAARLARRDAERTLTFLVEQQYAQAALARAASTFAKETAEASAETSRLVDVRYRAGAVSEADAARAETDALEAAQAADAAAASLASAKASLAFLLGARNAVPDFDVAEDLLTPRFPEALKGENAESLVKEAMEKRPDLAASRALVESARASLALARRQRIPDVSLSAGYSMEGTSQSAIQPPTASIGVGLTLPVFYRQKGEIARAEAALRSQELLAEKARAQVVADVTSALAAWRSASARVTRMQERLLDRSRRARDLVKIQYEKGAASLLELLDAQRTFITVNGEYRQSLTDHWTALFQLEEAVGMELR